MKRAAPALIALLVLAVVAPAHAVVTGSQVTAPADPFQGVYDLSAGQGPYGIRVAGSATASTVDDNVEIRCYGPTGVSAVLGTFAVDVPASTFSGWIEPRGLERPCVLRAVPPSAQSQPSDLTPFKGVRVYPTVFSDARVTALDSPNAGTLYDVFDRVVSPGRTSTLALGSLGGCGLYFARPLDPAADPSAGRSDVFNCAGWTDLTADGTPQSRSDIQVDGRNAFTGGMLQSSGGTMSAVPGMPGLSVQRAYDAASGALKLDETGAVVRCATELSPFPPANSDAAKSCSLVSAGVRYARTSQTSDDGRVVTVTDRWSSTDGAQHALDLLLEMDMSNATYGWEVPWLGAGFRAYPGTASISAAPSAPGSIFVRSDTTKDDGFDAPVGAITFSSAPDGIEFYDDGNPVSRFGQLHYVRTVPASGELRLQHSYSIGTSLSDVRALAGRIEDQLAGPVVAITSPKPNSTSRTSRITVTGTASDNVGVTALKLNGAGLALGPGGVWSRPVRLARGPNTLTVEATDAQQNRTQASVTVSYRQAGSCIVPKVVGLTRTRARKRLNGRRCALGKVTTKYFRARRVRKGRTTITVRYRRGRVVTQRIKPGSKVASGTRVGVSIQGRKPKR